MRLPWVWCIGAAMPAQSDAALALDGASPALAVLIDRASAALREPATPSLPGRAAAMHALGLLRLGDATACRGLLAAARRRLATEVHGPSWPDDVAWLVAATAWHLRTSGDRAAAATAWRTLQPLLHAAAAAPAERPAFAAEAMQVHALFCAGHVAASLERARAPGWWRVAAPLWHADEAWTERAIARQLELERTFFRDDLGCFVRASGWSPPVDAAALIPAHAGLLVATDDRLPRHLLRMLTAGSDDHAPGIDEAALRLAAAAQLADDGWRNGTFAEVLAAARSPLPPEVAGLVLDAIVFAITGARVATGAGVDDCWQRFAPWLPPGHRDLAVRGVLAGGCRYDVHLDARSGALGDDEVGAAMFDARVPERRVRAVIRLVHAPDAEARTIVVQCGGRQLASGLLPGEEYVCLLPRLQAEAQDDAPELRLDLALPDVGPLLRMPRLDPR